MDILRLLVCSQRIVDIFDYAMTTILDGSWDTIALKQKWLNTMTTENLWTSKTYCVLLCLQDPSAERQRRTLEAVNHVGVAIVSSAITTVISTVPLFFCTIMPFSKFGQIVAINTAISILFTLVVTTALLATMGPSHFTRPPQAVLKAGLVVLAVGLSGCLFWWTGSQLIPTSWSSLIT